MKVIIVLRFLSIIYCSWMSIDFIIKNIKGNCSFSEFVSLYGLFRGISLCTMLLTIR
ncbi:uncharacterized protein BX663DRAFT_506118 [Cokeromyces recurvatus]|uniref:uncharacterized protein n=1 Tax=Cokeromyces recurvatus TaxID=90255 RepID=UPI002220B3B0|nr:uncharacterized protein BX663DRAFT_506118 [Cokeromyces recurvatus]KAI7904012.1 hypothetical protein BX663DRAFT_506118 [Cokeromyces recurvatus]